MTERIIISIIASITLILTIRKGDKLSIILTIGLTLGIFVTWTGIPIVITIGMIIYMVSVLLISINGIINKELNIMDKILISLIGLWALSANLFSVIHWPYASEVKLSMIIPLTFYLILLGKGIVKKKEFGYLTILNADFLMRLLRF